MKKLIRDYSFDPINKQVVFIDALALEQILLITNVTSNQIIYNFADPASGGDLVNNTLTLNYDTTAMSNTDFLQIFVDIQEISNDDIYTLFSYFLDRLEYGMITDNAKRLKVIVDSATLAANQDIRTVTNLVNFGTTPANRFGETALDTAFNTGILGNITF